MAYKVKELAILAGISVRSLHYYDQIGLLKAADSTKSGYRLYSDNDLEKLQQIMFYKELGFSLQNIKQILNNPNFDRKKALQEQKKLLLIKKQRIEAIINLLEKSLSSKKGE
ncbi:MAG: MerR family transcriptional regulator, partial [Candidatus Margulisbacteria bacterium]|nr:MerR family transcriptional regulator [Candidatus Margulisiibacteriota bacterium]